MTKTIDQLKGDLEEKEKDHEEASNKISSLETVANLVPQIQRKNQELNEKMRILKEKHQYSTDKVNTLEEKTRFVPGLRMKIVEMNEQLASLSNKHTNALDKIKMFEGV